MSVSYREGSYGYSWMEVRLVYRYDLKVERVSPQMCFFGRVIENSIDLLQLFINLFIYRFIQLDLLLYRFRLFSDHQSFY
jgi:hypothetical protein